MVEAVQAASKLAVTSTALTQAIGSCGGVSITSQDVNGYASPLTTALTLDLASSAGTGTFYSDEACTTAITSLSWAAESQSVTVYYQDSAAGTPTFTFKDASDSGLGSVSSVATILAE